MWLFLNLNVTLCRKQVWNDALHTSNIRNNNWTNYWFKAAEDFDMHLLQLCYCHTLYCYTLPAVVGGDDHCVAHTRSSQAVPEFVEKPVEQRLQRQDKQKHAHKDAAGGLQSKLMGQFIISHHTIPILPYSPNYSFQTWGSGPLHECTRKIWEVPRRSAEKNVCP